MNIYYPPQFWKNKKFLFGITGGISAFKVAGYVSHLVQAGSDIQVIMTESAQQFIGKNTFNALTRKPVYTDLFESGEKILHIHLMREYEYFVVAPATANIIGKMAGGIGDDLLSSCFFVDPKKVIFAPAMNVDMWHNPIVQENIKKLISIGVRVMIPSSGNLACGEKGEGRLPEQEEFLEALYYFLCFPQPLQGKKVLITAGPTREYIDPIRYLTNSSSGLMGCSLAAAARARGADVTLIAGPMSVRIPSGVHFLPIVSTQDLKTAVLEEYDKTDICIMNAAIADYRPSNISKVKIKKQGKSELILNLIQNPDILSELGRRKVSQVLVGFCAEDGDIITEARQKLQQKNCDVMVANQILPGESGFEVDKNKAWFLNKSGEMIDIPLMSKMELAEIIIDQIGAFIFHNMNSALVALPLPVYKMFEYDVPQEMNEKIQPGTIVEVEFHGSHRFGCVWSVHPVSNEKDYKLKSILSCLALEPLARWQVELAEHIAHQTFSSLGEALELFIPKYQLSWEKWTRRRIFLPNDESEYFSDLKKYGIDPIPQGMNLFLFKELLELPTQKINQLIKKNRAIIAEEVFKRNQFILPLQKWVQKWWQRGTVAESLQLLGMLIEDSFHRGLKIFILLPSPKVLDYFFDNLKINFPFLRFLSFDGRLSARKRMLLYHMVREGHFDVLLGTRLAQFLPIHQVGVHVLFDPEDFGHYSDRYPHYHSFFSLIGKVKITGGDLHILGTIPDLTQYFGLQEGYFEFQRWQNKTSSKEQKLELITYNQKKGILSQLVQKALAQNKASLQNSIIWVQKTGYSVALGCSDCGFYYSCPDCDVAFRFYQKEMILQCPRCGKKVIPESFCPECHGPWMKTWGEGIEKVYQFLKRIFPGISIIKVTSDQERSELNFTTGEPMIIVGTSAALNEEILTRSTLFIIHSFEDWLFLPEFQVREKFYQNIQRSLFFLGAALQYPTRVLIETAKQYQKFIDPFFLPPSEFYKIELEKRKKYGYPPSKGLLQVVARSRNKMNREMVLNMLKNELNVEKFEMSGPFPGESHLKKSGLSDQFMIKFDQSLLDTLYDKVTAFIEARKNSGVEVDFKVYNTLPYSTKDDL